MSDISTEIKRINDAKDAIKAAIEAKGVTVGGGTIDTYASKISEISSSSTKKTITVTVITNNPGHQYNDLAFFPNWNTDTDCEEDHSMYYFDLLPEYLQDNNHLIGNSNYVNGLTICQQSIPVSSVSRRLITIQDWIGQTFLIEEGTCTLSVYAQTTDSYFGNLLLKDTFTWDSSLIDSGGFWQNAYLENLDGDTNFVLYFDFTAPEIKSSKICINFMLTSFNSTYFNGYSKESNALLIDLNNDNSLNSINVVTPTLDTYVFGGSVRKYHSNYCVIDVLLGADYNKGLNGATSFAMHLPEMNASKPWSVANTTITNGTGLTATVDSTNKEITISFVPQSDDFVAGAIILNV